MEDLNFRKGDAKTEAFGSNRMLQPSPVEKIPDGPTTPVSYTHLENAAGKMIKPASTATNVSMIPTLKAVRVRLVFLLK